MEPNANQCAGCHNENLTVDQMTLLGVKVRHMDKPHLHTAENQLVLLNDRGWLPEINEPLTKNVSWKDERHAVDIRARSYLDINYSHCHNPNGPADTSGMFLHAAETSDLRLGVCKPPIAAGQGTGGYRVGIEPGDADASILTYRMLSLDPGAMMPELGRSLVHEEGVQLISDWINQMPGEC